MRSLKPPLSVLLAALMLTSCSSSNRPVTVPPAPPPAVLQIPCPIPVEPADDSADAAALALKQLYDQYGQCAGKYYERLKGTGNDDGH